MGFAATLIGAGRGGTRRRIPPKGLFENGIERLLRRALDQAKSEIELGADVGAFVAGQGERHEALGLDLGVGAAEAGVELVGGGVEFGGHRFG